MEGLFLLSTQDAGSNGFERGGCPTGTQQVSPTEGPDNRLVRRARLIHTGSEVV